MTTSALYDATILHARGEPRHRVRYRARYAYLDLDTWPAAVARRRYWSTRRLAPVRLRRADYLDGTDRPWRAALDDLVTERTGRRPPGPVGVLTQLRTVGWLFNPLTTYFCLSPDGTELVAAVLEITNTPWHERHWYVLDGDHLDGRPFPKTFHVSPFLPMGLTYRLRTGVPGAEVGITLDARDATDQPVFTARLDGTRRPLDAPPRMAATAQTIGVSAAIYGHAFRLRARGAPFHRHPTHAWVDR